MQKSNSNRKATSRQSDNRADNTSNSEFLYSEIINQMEEAVHVVDSDLNLILFNNTVRGWSDDFDIPVPLQGMSLRKLCPFLSEAVFDEYKEVFVTGESHFTPESCIIIDGWEHIRETYKIPIKEKGRTVYVITIIRNITDSVRTRNMATSLYRIARTPFISSDSRELYRELYGVIKVLFPAAIFSIVLYDKSTGAISNPLTGELHGDTISADPMVEELEQQVIRTGKTVQIYSNNSQERLSKSGEVKSSRSLISAWIGTPLRINAETIGVLSLKPNKLGMQFTEKHREILEFVSDQVAMLIERKRMLVSLSESEEKYRNLVERASDGIAIIQDSRIVFANRELIRVLGFETDEITGSEFGKVFFSQEDAVKFEAGTNVTDVAKAACCKIRLKKRDESVIYVELNRSATTYRGNRAELVFIRDITERHKTEEEKNKLQIRIQHAQKLESIGMLAGGIAHDFNNLLMGILGNASLSLDHLPPESMIRKNIERIETSALRAADLTNQLLAYSGKGIF
ncbi:MAG: PAS domain S-box protein, partial [Candidatus Aegiribacteria sp.]|nr:PAS domain S-box protein [Candidatus Aegiribacteria sp.]